MPAPVVTSGSQTSPFGNGGQWLCEATNTPTSWAIVGSPPTGVGLYDEGGPGDTYVTWDDTTPVGEHTITVRATNGSGTGDGTLTLTIESTTSPVVSAVSPSSGTTAGGTAVTITGENFETGAEVFIGPAAATSVVVVSATSITCVTPAGTAGARDVTVRNPDASEGALFNGFTYSSGVISRPQMSIGTKVGL
jgi:large repetitive protein